MIDSTIQRQLHDELEQLTVDQQRLVLDYARQLSSTPQRGVSGKSLLRFAGLIDAEDLATMTAAIEANCEQVDADEW